MAPSINVQNLSYKFQDGSDGLKDVGLSLPSGSRTLLIGGMTPLILYIEDIKLTEEKQTAPEKRPSCASYPAKN